MPNQEQRNKMPQTNHATNITNSKKINKVFPILGLVLCVALAVMAGFFLLDNPNGNTVTKKVDRLDLTGFNNTYVVGSDFRVINEQSLEQSGENTYYKIKSDYSIETIRSGAQKLALSNEAYNSKTRFRAWTRQGVNNLGTEFITVDEQNRFLQLRIYNGINTNNITENEAYGYIADFFGLNKSNVEVFSSNKSGNSISLTYRYKFNDKYLVFDGVEETYATIRIVSGKITEVFTFLIPLETEAKNQLKKIEKISSANLSPLSYQLQLKSDGLGTSSQYGAEDSFVPPADIGFRKSTQVYKAWNDPIIGYVIMPSHLLTGVYTDSNSQRGTFSMVVVNQDV